MGMTDHLEEDLPIPNQEYVCISFMSPDKHKSTIHGVKIRGVYPNLEQANERAKQLQKMDPLFDIYVGQVGKWLAWDSKDHLVAEASNKSSKKSKKKTKV